MATVSLDGLGGFREKMTGLVDRTVKAIGVAIARRAQELAPVDTGRLKASIHADPEAGPLKVRIVAGMNYSLFVEFGTSRTRAQPFLRPAFAEAPRLWRALGDTELAFPATPEPYGLAPGRRTGLGRASVSIRGSRPFGAHPSGAPVGRAT
jgi:HK97 gp10 family phage protein